MPSRVIGKNRKPAALIVGFDGAMAERIGRLFPARQVIEHLDEVEQKEWDVRITTRSALGADYHLYVIGIGCDAYAPPGRAELPSSFGPYHHDAPRPRSAPRSPPRPAPRPPGAQPASRVQWTGGSRARELHIAENLPASVERLVVTKLGPLAQTEENHQFLQPNSVLEPFLTTMLDQYLAGRFPRPGRESECWCFPAYAVSIAPEIVEVALCEWQKRDPERFPVADWANKAMWRTPAENRVARELDKLNAKRTAILADLDERQEQFEAQLTEAKQSAATNERLLLTAQSDDLVNAVAECLSELGFDITRMDEVHTKERLEDLRVTSPGQSWTALVEIKGYSGGAKSNDLQKFGRYWLQYFKDEGKEPDAGWYIVNQFLQDDPSARRPILLGNDAALSTFIADNNGLAIDTADLFRLWMAVKEQRLTAEEARSRLMQTRGRFTF
jgi:hypothetical protein